MQGRERKQRQRQTGREREKEGEDGNACETVWRRRACKNFGKAKVFRI